MNINTVGQGIDERGEAIACLGRVQIKDGGQAEEGKMDRSRANNTGEEFPFATKPNPALFRAFEGKSGPWASYHLLLVPPVGLQ
jgi:hypothetical protein